MQVFLAGLSQQMRPVVPFLAVVMVQQFLADLCLQETNGSGKGAEFSG
jgi:hypothetical protein